MKFTYGSDFEMMIRNRNYRKPEKKKSGFFTSSNFVSYSSGIAPKPPVEAKKVVHEYEPVCGKLGGTKKEPLQIPNAPAGYLYQEDGVSAEFNTPICESVPDLISSIRQAQAYARALVPAKMGADYEPHGISAAWFDASVLEQYPQANVIGCDPDFQAWEQGAERQVPEIETFGGFRFAGFHIHVGYDLAIFPPWMMAGCLDLYLADYADPTCMTRADYYPRGIFRPKPYGVEYRALGSSWLNYLDSVEDKLTRWEHDMQKDWGDVLNRMFAFMDERLEQQRERAQRVFGDPQPVEDFEDDPEDGELFEGDEVGVDWADELGNDAAENGR